MLILIYYQPCCYRLGFPEKQILGTRIECRKFIGGVSGINIYGRERAGKEEKVSLGLGRAGSRAVVGS